MANPVDSMNENFVYNSMLARALIQLLPKNEKQVIRVWLDKLHGMEGNADELTNRNEYMWFLLLMLQNKKISIPFNCIPPTNKLRPLKEILPGEVYEEVLTATDQNMSWLEQLTTSAQGDKMVPGASSSPKCKPSKFLGSQPVPKNGIICYMAAFSDHD